MFTGATIQAERRRVIEAHRRAYPGETAGHPDHTVEAMALGLADASAEALAFELRRRGYTVALEVG